MNAIKLQKIHITAHLRHKPNSAGINTWQNIQHPPPLIVRVRTYKWFSLTKHHLPTQVELQNKPPTARDYLYNATFWTGYECRPGAKNSKWNLCKVIVWRLEAALQPSRSPATRGRPRRLRQSGCLHRARHTPLYSLATPSRKLSLCSPCDTAPLDSAWKCRSIAQRWPLFQCAYSVHSNRCNNKQNFQQRRCVLCSRWIFRTYVRESVNKVDVWRDPQ